MAQETTEPNTKKDRYLTIRVDEDLFDKLAELADRSERSTSSEGRLAIRRHVDENIKARPHVVAGGNS